MPSLSPLAPGRALLSAEHAASPSCTILYLSNTSPAACSRLAGRFAKTLPALPMLLGHPLAMCACQRGRLQAQIMLMPRCCEELAIGISLAPNGCLRLRRLMRPASKGRPLRLLQALRPYDRHWRSHASPLPALRSPSSPPAAGALTASGSAASSGMPASAHPSLTHSGQSPEG